VHCWNATQYYSTETVLLIFPFPPEQRHCWNATQYYSTETVLLIFPFPPEQRHCSDEAKWSSKRDTTEHKDMSKHINQLLFAVFLLACKVRQRKKPQVGVVSPDVNSTTQLANSLHAGWVNTTTIYTVHRPKNISNVLNTQGLIWANNNNNNNKPTISNAP